MLLFEARACIYTKRMPRAISSIIKPTLSNWIFRAKKVAIDFFALSKSGAGKGMTR